MDYEDSIMMKRTSLMNEDEKKAVFDRIKGKVLDIFQRQHANRALVLLHKAFLRWAHEFPLYQKCDELSKQLKERVWLLEQIRSSHLRDVVHVKYHLNKIKEYEEFDGNSPNEPSLSVIKEDLKELAAVPSADLRPLLDKVANSQSQFSSQFKSSLVETGLVDPITLKTLNPWENGYSYKRLMRIKRGPSWAPPETGGECFPLAAPSSHKVFIRQCDKCIGVIKLIKSWHDEIENSLQFTCENHQLALKLEEYKKIIDKLNDIIELKEKEILRLENKCGEIETADSWFTKWSFMKDTQAREEQMIEENIMLRNLAQMTIADKEGLILRNQYQNLVKFSSMESQIRELNELLRFEREQRDSEGADRANLLEKVHNSKITLINKQNKISYQEQLLHDKDEKIIELEKQIEKFKQSIEEKNKIIEEKEAAFNDLKYFSDQKIRQLEDLIEEYQSDLTKLQKETDDLRTTLKQRKNELDKCNKLIDELKFKVGELEELVKQSIKRRFTFRAVVQAVKFLIRFGKAAVLKDYTLLGLKGYRGMVYKQKIQILTFTEQNNNLEAAVKRLEASRLRERDARENMLKKLLEAQEELSNVRATLKDTSADLAHKLAMIKKLEREIEQSNKRETELNYRLSDARIQINVLSQRVERSIYEELEESKKIGERRGRFLTQFQRNLTQQLGSSLLQVRSIIAGLEPEKELKTLLKMGKTQRMQYKEFKKEIIGIVPLETDVEDEESESEEETNDVEVSPQDLVEVGDNGIEEKKDDEAESNIELQESTISSTVQSEFKDDDYSMTLPNHEKFIHKANKLIKWIRRNKPHSQITPFDIRHFLSEDISNDSNVPKMSESFVSEEGKKESSVSSNDLKSGKSEIINNDNKIKKTVSQNSKKSENSHTIESPDEPDKIPGNPNKNPRLVTLLRSDQAQIDYLKKVALQDTRHLEEYVFHLKQRVSSTDALVQRLQNQVKQERVIIRQYKKRAMKQPASPPKHKTVSVSSQKTNRTDRNAMQRLIEVKSSFSGLLENDVHAYMSNVLKAIEQVQKDHGFDSQSQSKPNDEQIYRQNSNTTGASGFNSRKSEKTNSSKRRRKKKKQKNSLPSSFTHLSSHFEVNPSSYALPTSQGVPFPHSLHSSSVSIASGVRSIEPSLPTLGEGPEESPTPSPLPGQTPLRINSKNMLSAFTFPNPNGEGVEEDGDKGLAGDHQMMMNRHPYANSDMFEYPAGSPFFLGGASTMKVLQTNRGNGPPQGASTYDAQQQLRNVKTIPGKRPNPAPGDSENVLSPENDGLGSGSDELGKVERVGSSQSMLSQLSASYDETERAINQSMNNGEVLKSHRQVSFSMDPSTGGNGVQLDNSIFLESQEKEGEEGSEGEYETESDDSSEEESRVALEFQIAQRELTALIERDTKIQNKIAEQDKENIFLRDELEKMKLELDATRKELDESRAGLSLEDMELLALSEQLDRTNRENSLLREIVEEDYRFHHKEFDKKLQQLRDEKQKTEKPKKLSLKNLQNPVNNASDGTITPPTSRKLKSPAPVPISPINSNTPINSNIPINSNMAINSNKPPKEKEIYTPSSNSSQMPKPHESFSQALKGDVVLLPPSRNTKSSTRGSSPSGRTAPEEVERMRRVVSGLQNQERGRSGGKSSGRENNLRVGIAELNKLNLNDVQDSMSSSIVGNNVDSWTPTQKKASLNNFLDSASIDDIVNKIDIKNLSRNDLAILQEELKNQTPTLKTRPKSAVGLINSSSLPVFNPGKSPYEFSEPSKFSVLKKIPRKISSVDPELKNPSETRKRPQSSSGRLNKYQGYDSLLANNTFKYSKSPVKIPLRDANLRALSNTAAYLQKQMWDQQQIVEDQAIAKFQNSEIPNDTESENFQSRSKYDNSRTHSQIGDLNENQSIKQKIFHYVGVGIPLVKYDSTGDNNFDDSNIEKSAIYLSKSKLELNESVADSEEEEVQLSPKPNNSLVISLKAVPKYTETEDENKNVKNEKRELELNSPSKNIRKSVGVDKMKTYFHKN